MAPPCHHADSYNVAPPCPPHAITLTATRMVEGAVVGMFTAAVLCIFARATRGPRVGGCRGWGSAGKWLLRLGGCRELAPEPMLLLGMRGLQIAFLFE